MDKRTVTVTGQGDVAVVPDSAVVRVAALARAGRLAEALGGATSAAGTIGAVARRHTSERRVATTGINVWPWHDDHGQQQGFEARHSLAIGCPDVAIAGVLLDALATEVGDALVVEGVSLEVSEPGAARDEAVAQAYADAHRQAGRLAELAGASLGEVLAIGEAVAGVPRPGATASLSAKIEPGETSISAGLTVTWALV
ncbi:SIMPL domain-containing protein [Nocardioides piscis]|uniref:SIMPL domain-containing protein n=1 Tax=Nocardioides piscis TaxID=2714938 RepID=A0A6G7YJD9_9ACTN|nr:SIMPL domain-containing protein [Nocardioides piscis]QIK76847.1 SIMPL domain-containing protein [Nocardioides piscis]